MAHRSRNEDDKAFPFIKQAINITRRTILSDSLLVNKQEILLSILGEFLAHDDNESLSSESNQTCANRSSFARRLFQQASLYKSQKLYDKALSIIAQLLTLELENHSLQPIRLIEVYILQAECQLKKKSLSEALQCYHNAEQIAIANMPYACSHLRNIRMH
ncbi:hypothetical protein I4U23_011033 [Adineta vaga]|nr:hypothetical protein I4U23_011033 [Adineta vaga]